MNSARIPNRIFVAKNKYSSENKNKKLAKSDHLNEITQCDKNGKWQLN